MILADLQDLLFKVSVRNKNYVFGFFWILYILIVITILVSAFLNLSKNSLDMVFYDLGVWYGRASLFMLSLTVFPGILGRFKIKIPITFIITRYRRQFGITVFLLALSHYLMVNIIPQIGGIFPLVLWPALLFMQFGLISLILLFFMFITSNNWSVIRLKKWWKRLHRVVYIILWLIFLHVFLQNKVSFWTIWIGLIATLEVLSLLYFYILKKGK